jgi:uncharacterized membrane protein YeiB
LSPDSRERIHALDALRGLALLGVLATNLETEFRISIFQAFIGPSLIVVWHISWTQGWMFSSISKRSRFFPSCSVLDWRSSTSAWSGSRAVSNCWHVGFSHF